MKELQQQVVKWAQDKGLLTDVTPERIEKQTLKVLEELGETAGAYLKCNRPKLIDGIGDVAVTLIVLGAMKGHKIDTVDYRRSDQKAIFSITESLLFYNQDNDYLWLCHAYDHLYFFALDNELTLENCLQSAYDVISKRTGKMVNGTFIKDK